MLELSKDQWQAWERQVLADFIDRTIDGWHQHFPNPARRFGHAVQDDSLRQHAQDTIQACERKRIQDAPTVTTLILLVWQSAALGLPKACMADCLAYAIYDCGGSQFGVQWFEHFVRQTERALHTPATAHPTRPAHG